MSSSNRAGGGGGQNKVEKGRDYHQAGKGLKTSMNNTGNKDVY